MNSGHRSTSISTSYTDAGVAVDGCSTLHDADLAMTRKLLRAAAVWRERMSKAA
jgi:hypothetical protein